MNNILKKYNFPLFSYDEYKLLIGDGIEIFVERVLPNEFRNDEWMKKIMDEMRIEYEKNWSNKTKPFSGINELLKILITKNVKFAVLSNKPHRFTNLCIEKYFNEFKFDAIIGAQEGIPKKPDPAGINKIKEIFKLDDNQIYFIGDSGVDILTAKNANIIPIGALWGYRMLEELINSGAKYIAKHPLDIIDIISISF